MGKFLLWNRLHGVTFFTVQTEILKMRRYDKNTLQVLIFIYIYILEKFSILFGDIHNLGCLILYKQLSKKTVVSSTILEITTKFSNCPEWFTGFSKVAMIERYSRNVTLCLRILFDFRISTSILTSCFAARDD